jgi:hypothetical protein
MKFKRIHILSLLLIFVISYVAYFSGCNTNDLITPEDQDVTVEAAFMRSTSEMISICSNVNTYLVLISNGVINFPGSCPEIHVYSSANYFIVDYGSGCILDSIKRSGSYVVNYHIYSTRDSISAILSYSNFKVYKTVTDSNYASITGNNNIFTINVLGNTYQSKFNISNYFTSNTGNSKNINIILSVPNAVINNTLPMSGTFYITGSGTLNSINQSLTYDYTADPSFPVVYSSDCKFPTSGKVYLDNSGNRFTSDYSPNNDCKGVISITKFGTIKYVNLTTASF